MSRLLVNPGTQQAWEIQLKPGVNRIGRAEDNDFTIPHASVSSRHCEISVGDDGVRFKDLGSTNGSFISRAKVAEAILQHGQHLQLGAVDLIFETAAGAAAPVSTSAPVRVSASVVQPAAAPSAPIRVTMPPPPAGGLRISKPHQPTPQTEIPVAEAAEEEVADAPAAPPMQVRNAFCKSHVKTPARFYCGKCRHYFCDLCVGTRNTSGVAVRFCRHCGTNCTPVMVQRSAGVPTRGFFVRLPGAFIYPFKGMGVIILIFAAFIFAVLKSMSGIFNILLTMAATGYLFVFMQNIIHTTVSDENESLSLAAPDDVFIAFFRLTGTVLLSFGLPIALLVAKFFEVIDVPMVAILVLGVLGCFYFPMSFLAVAMKDNILAISPMIVIPSILRIPLEYFVASVIFLGVFAIRFVGDAMAGAAEDVSFSTKDMNVLFMAIGFRMIWSLMSVYVLTVSMRIMGLLYLTKKDKLGWF